MKESKLRPGYYWVSRKGKKYHNYPRFIVAVLEIESLDNCIQIHEIYGIGDDEPMDIKLLKDFIPVT